MTDLDQARATARAAVAALNTIPAFDTLTVTISITPIEILALKKLSLVSHALAQKIGGPAGKEQTVLATCLDELVRQIEIKGAV